MTMRLAALAPFLWGMAYLVSVLVLTRRSRPVPRDRATTAPTVRRFRDAA